jgi:hypothetical protein
MLSKCPGGGSPGIPAKHTCFLSKRNPCAPLRDLLPAPKAAHLYLLLQGVGL